MPTRTCVDFVINLLRRFGLHYTLIHHLGCIMQIQLGCILLDQDVLSFSVSKNARCLDASDDGYQQMKGHINLTKCILLGFALCNEQCVPAYEDNNPCIRDFN